MTFHYGMASIAIADNQVALSVFHNQWRKFQWLINHVLSQTICSFNPGTEFHAEFHLQFWPATA